MRVAIARFLLDVKWFPLRLIPYSWKMEWAREWFAHHLWEEFVASLPDESEEGLVPPPL